MEAKTIILENMTRRDAVDAYGLAAKVEAATGRPVAQVAASQYDPAAKKITVTYYAA